MNKPKFNKEEAVKFDERLLNRVQKESTEMSPDQMIAKIQRLQTAVDKKSKGWNRSAAALPVWKFVANMAGVEWEDEEDKNLQQAVDAELILAKQYVKKQERAAQRNIRWELTISQFKKIMSRKTCAYLGCKFTEDNKPTLDRVDPGKPYCVGNVYKVCDKANQIKNALFEQPSGRVPDRSVRISFSDMNTLMRNLKKVGFDKVIVERD